MDDKKRAENNDLDELRRLLLGAELDELEELRDRIESPERFSSEVGEILPQAMIKSSRQGERLSEAMVPTVEEIVRLSIKKDINKFADTLFPVIGPAIRKSIKETIRQMMQSLNQALEQSISWQGVKWRLESLRTGIPFAEIAMLHGLVYRVEQAFLIHRETGLLLCHLNQDQNQTQNPDLVSSMLSAINDFVGDSFEIEDITGLNSVDVGELAIWIEPGPNTILALAIRGEAPSSLRTTMQQILEEIEASLADELDGFNGDTVAFTERAEMLEPCLQARYQPGKKGFSPKMLLFLLALLLLLGYWIGNTLYRAQQHATYIDLLKSESGYIVTDSSSDNGVLYVRGLRDPLARAPENVLAESPLPPEAVNQRFSPFQSLDPEFVIQRAQRILNPPASVEMTLEEGRLRVSGYVDLAWREQLLSKLPLIAGIDGLDADALQIRFTPELLDLPPEISAEFDNGVLYFSGAADQEQIGRLSRLPADYPEISAVDTRALVNLTEVALIREIEALEDEVVYFDVASSAEFDKVVGPQITALVDTIVSLARQLSRDALIVITGSSDSAGSFESNLALSNERANRVARILYDSGISPENIVTQGIEQPTAVEASENERRHNRRVTFSVIVE